MNWNKDDLEILSLITAPQTKNLGFKLLFSNYKQMIYDIIRKMVIVHDDADDIFQNTMIKIYLNIEKFEKKSKLSTWVYRIAYNECLTFLSSKKQIDNQSKILNDVSKFLKSDSYFDGDEATIHLQNAIYQLPPQQKIVFHLRYYDEKTFKEIAEILQLTEGGAKSNYHLAVLKIEKFINKLT